MRGQRPHPSAARRDLLPQQRHLLRPFERSRLESRRAGGGPLQHAPLRAPGHGVVGAVRAGQVAHVAPGEGELGWGDLVGGHAQPVLAHLEHQLALVEEALAEARVVPSWAHLRDSDLRGLALLARLEKRRPLLVGAEELASAQAAAVAAGRVRRVRRPEEPEALVAVIVYTEELILDVVKLGVGKRHGGLHGDGPQSEASGLQPGLGVLGVHAALGAVHVLFDGYLLHHACDAGPGGWAVQVAVGYAHWSHLQFTKGRLRYDFFL